MRSRFLVESPPAGLCLLKYMSSLSRTRSRTTQCVTYTSGTSSTWNASGNLAVHLIRLGESCRLLGTPRMAGAEVLPKGVVISMFNNARQSAFIDQLWCGKGEQQLHHQTRL